MQLISKYIKEFQFVLHVTHVFSAYAWVVDLKDKKVLLLLMLLKKYQKSQDVNQTKYGQIKVLNFIIGQNNYGCKAMIEMNSTHNEGTCVVTEKMFRTQKNKLQKYIILVIKIAYIDKLDDLFNKYNNTYHKTMKMKPKDMESSTYVDIGVENNDKYPKFEVVHHFGISKYKAIFSNSYTPY